MTIQSKPWKEDKEIKEEMQYDVLRKRRSSVTLSDTSIQRIDTDNIISSLFGYAPREEKYEELEDRYNHMVTQDIDRQNREAIQDLEDIFGIDPDDVFEPYEMEGMLSNYSDDQSSTEWVRSVRSGT